MKESPMFGIGCLSCRFIGRHTFDSPVTILGESFEVADMIVCGSLVEDGFIILKYGVGGEFYVKTKDKKLDWSRTNRKVRELSEADRALVSRGFERAHALAIGNLFCRGQAMFI